MKLPCPVVANLFMWEWWITFVQALGYFLPRASKKTKPVPCKSPSPFSRLCLSLLPPLVVRPLLVLARVVRFLDVLVDVGYWYGGNCAGPVPWE